MKDARALHNTEYILFSRVITPPLVC